MVLVPVPPPVITTTRSFTLKRLLASRFDMMGLGALNSCDLLG